MCRNRLFLAACLLAGAGVASTASAQLVWNPTYNATTSGPTAANGVNPFQNANWTDTGTGLAYTGTIASATAVNKALTVNGGYLNFTTTTGQRLALGTGSLTVTDGLLRFHGANAATVYGYISNGATGSDAAGQPAVAISGGRVWCTAVQDLAVTLSGTGTLRLGGSGTANAVTTGGAADPIAFTSTVNITSEGAALEFARKAAAAVVTDHVGTNEILIDNAPLVQNTAVYPAAWNGNAAITETALNQYGTFTTVRKQTNWVGSCVAGGGCTITYEASCGGTWTQGGSCAGSCTVSGVCTPVATSAGCGGTYAMGGACTPGLFQPADASFEGTDCSVAYGNATSGLTCSTTAPAFNSVVANWFNGDDISTRVMVADGTSVLAPINGGGSNWGYAAIPTNGIHLGGVWTRIGNYDPGHGDYTIGMDVADRASTTFNMVRVQLWVGNGTPSNFVVPGEIGLTPLAPLVNATAASIWGGETTTAKTGSTTLTVVPTTLGGIPPQAGDALYLLICDNNPGAAALFDNIAVLGSCCDVAAACTMTAQGACASPSAWDQNGSCTPSNPCVAPNGECCVGTSCTVTTSGGCSGMGGVWSIGGSCSPGPCNAPTGNCCVAGACSLSVEATCAGAWTLNGSCSPNPCAARCCAGVGGCTLQTQDGCAAAGGAWTQSGGVCDPNPCPQPTASCCDNNTGACTLIYQGACTTGSTAGVGAACDANACPVVRVCCNNTTGVCAPMYGGTACTSGSTAGVGTACDANACPVVRVCCNNTTGVCAPMYGGTACTSGSTAGVGTACDANACPVVRVCCNNTTAACAPMYGGTVCTGGSTAAAGLACETSTCDFVLGACCQQGGVCAVMSSSACAALALPGTHLGTAVACPGGLCFGEHEPNSDNFGAFLSSSPNLNPASMGSGDSISGITTGGGFDSGLHGYTNGPLSNPFVDLWLVSTTAAPPGIYRHEMTMIQGAAGYGIRGRGQNAGALAYGNLGIQGASGTSKLTVWYGFGKQESMILEPFSGSSVPYVIQLNDTPVSPTVATGSLAAGNVTVRVVNSGATAIDSDTWLYDGNFNALVNGPGGPGGADGVFANTAPDPAGTTTSFIRNLPAGTYYLAVCPTNLANDQPNDAAEGIDSTATGGPNYSTLYFPDAVLCTRMNQTADYTCHVELTDASSTTVVSPDLTWTGSVAAWNGLIHFVQFTVGGGASGVCCRGATCSTAYADATACAGALDSVSGTVLSAFVASSGTCNTPVTTPGMLGNTTGPCCYANYNHNATLEVQDIFDFLNDWFAGKKATLVGGDGDTGTLTVQNIFDFLNAWFAGGCA